MQHFFGSKKRSTTLHQIETGKHDCQNIMKGRATFFRSITIVGSFLHLMVLLFKVLLNHTSKRQFLVLHVSYLSWLSDLLIAFLRHGAIAVIIRKSVNIFWIFERLWRGVFNHVSSFKRCSLDCWVFSVSKAAIQVSLPVMMRLNKESPWERISWVNWKKKLASLETKLCDLTANSNH